MEACIDACQRNFIGDRVHIGGLMHRSRRSRAADRYLWDVSAADHFLDYGGHRTTEDAVRTWIFWMQWCGVERLPGRIALGRCVAIDISVADRRHWPPKQIVPLCGKHRLYGICFGNGNQRHKSRGIDD